jgi:hypothetical protein
LRTVIWNDHGQPDDARSDEYRGVGAGSHLLHAFEQRIEVVDAGPNPKIAALDVAQNAVKSPRQVAGELGEDFPVDAGGADELIAVDRPVHHRCVRYQAPP